MELPEEVTNILYKNTIQYLHDVANQVPNTLNVLKSYYASKFRISELQTKICLEKSKNKLDARCPKCCLKLRETGASYFVKPETRKSKFAKKLLKKVKAQKRLTRFQAKYLKSNNLNAENKLVVTCSFCKKEVSHTYEKPVKRRKYKKAKKQSKKNAKKKDKFCGLREEAVISVQSSEKHNILNNEFTKRKEKLQEKRKLSKLTKMLKQKTNNKSGSALTQFLQSLNK